MVKFRTDKRDGHKYAVEEHGGFASEILGGRNSEPDDREQELLDNIDEIQTPEIKIHDEETDIFYTWYGGESHYVHLEDENGKEFDVFSFGFDKNKLSPSEVKSMILKHIKEDRKEREDE